MTKYETWRHAEDAINRKMDEDAARRGTMTVSCVHCNRGVEVHCTEEQYERWLNGEGPIQAIMPDTPKEEREVFLSGICGKCWNEIFRKGRQQ